MRFPRHFLPLVVCLLIMPASAAAAGAGERPIRVLMFVGGAYHDYEKLPKVLAERLAQRGEVAVEVTSDLASLNARRIEKVDVLLFNTCIQEWPQDAAKEAVLGHLRAGKGLIALHCALWSFQDWPAWAAMVGGFAPGHDKYGPFPVIVLDFDHPVMLGLGSGFEMTDEPYWVEKRATDANVLVRTSRVHKGREGKDRDGPEPQVWTRTVEKGRVLSITFGHDEKSQSDEDFITLLHNGIRWVARRMPDPPHNTLTDSEEKVGFELLFNGKDLSGWLGEEGIWSVEEGNLVGRARDLKRQSYLFYDKREYGDFELRLSVKLDGGAGNSGVQYRSVRLPEFDVRGYQADIAAGIYGSLYDVNTGRGMMVDGWKDQGEKVAVVDGWNHLVIRAEGPRSTIRLNGVTTADFTETDAKVPRKGLIAFQVHPGPPMEVRFRDIRIREIKSDR